MATVRGLNELANCYGLQTSYQDVTGKRRTATSEALVAALSVMGAPVRTAADVPEALRAFHAGQVAQLLEPVLVVWNGQLGNIILTLPDSDTGTVHAQIEMEAGGHQEWQWPADQLPFDEASPEPVSGVRRSMPLRGTLPLGYHVLRVTYGDRTGEAMLLAAPRRLDSGPMVGPKKEWGVFAPFYAIQGSGGWGAGSVTEFGEFAEWVRAKGGTLVASLPLLASFYDNLDDTSPYSPASRLFWNELYVDVARVPEFAQCAEAQQLVSSPAFQQAVEELRRDELVDARRVMRLKREALEPMCRVLSSGSTARREAFEAFRRESVELDRYAAFRAACERLGRPWWRWPEPACDGVLGEEPADAAAAQYHRYAQWLAHEQLEELSRTAQNTGMTWYLDVPLGTHPDGFDVWRFRTSFARGAAGGAPPDAFFTQGQNWGFPPLHPYRLRAERYEYFVRVVRHHLRQARLLRLDHVMGLHRLYWVPDGLPASQGVYVRYPAEELYAILLLEAHRLGASIIGENLGTVPSYVNRAMRTHRFGRLYVFQYEWNAVAMAKSVRPPDADEVASLNTHDMPTFASWWQGTDIDDRLDLRLLSEAEADDERATRQRLRSRIVELLRADGALASHGNGSPESLEAAEVLRGCLQWLGGSESQVVLVNLEDLWLETLPQNTPGTVTQRVNWRRKARLSLAELETSEAVRTLLAVLREARAGASAGEQAHRTG